jgi:glutathione S-transferase
MDKLSFQNPLFSIYAVAGCIMILKAVMMSWLTVVRMMRVKGGYRSPEDIRKTILNPNPSAEQLAPSEYVDRIRRIQLNDLEKSAVFPDCWISLHLDRSINNARPMATVRLCVSRLLHFGAYFTARTHDTRATHWTIGSLNLYELLVALSCSALMTSALWGIAGRRILGLAAPSRLYARDTACRPEFRRSQLVDWQCSHFSTSP